MKHKFKICILSLITIAITACGSNSVRIPDISELEGSPAGIQIVKNALQQIGKPYVFGGNSPNGFDCSGLVQYSHSLVGVETPRIAIEQFQGAQPVNVSDLRAGDLVFFRLSAYNKTNHVGIYMGQGFFIHAPSPGKTVSVISLRHPYWRDRISGAGRYY